MVDDARVRLTRFDLAPDAETGWHAHVHVHDHAIAAVTDCIIVLEEPGGGTREVVVPMGAAHRREAGGEHNVVNAGRAAMSFVAVALKEPAPAA